MRYNFNLIILLSSLLFLSISNAQNYGTWREIDSMKEARYSHSAIELNDGRVLIVGGVGAIDPNSCEIYDPITNKWSLAAKTNFERWRNQIIMLDSERILSVGSPVTKYCEIYNPKFNTWTITDSLKVGRVSARHRVIKLFNGKIVVIGGFTRDYQEPEKQTLNSCELYNEVTGKWSNIDSMKVKRSTHSALLLQDGRVLVVGGGSPINLRGTCEIYDPYQNKWSLVASLNKSREYPKTVLLPNGDVLALAGFSTTGMFQTRSVELYETNINNWKLADSLQFSEVEEAFILDDKNIITIGRDYNQRLVWEIYDFIELKSKYIGYISDAGSIWNNKLQLNDGKILVSGGVKTQDYEVLLPTKTVWLFDRNITNVDEYKTLVSKDMYYQNYPNPFNPTTKISFALAQKSKIILKVFDLLGREIKILADGIYEAGKYEFDFDGSTLPSGLYFYNLTHGAYSITKKMLLIK